VIDYASCSRGEKQVRTKPFPAEPHLKTERKAEQDISCSGVHPCGWTRVRLRI
jgi:hypothetical protein